MSTAILVLLFTRIPFRATTAALLGADPLLVLLGFVVVPLSACCQAGFLV